MMDGMDAFQPAGLRRAHLEPLAEALDVEKEPQAAARSLRLWHRRSTRATAPRG